MSPLHRMIRFSITILGGALITFGLFILIPLMHRFFGYDLQPGAGLKQRPAIQVERVTPPKKQEVVRQQRIRPVSTARAEGERGAGKLDMRFTPDLGIDAGPGSGDAVVLQKQELGAEVFEEGQTDETAVPLYQPPVPYPDRAREMGIQGMLELNYVVDHQGKTSSLEIIRTPSPLISAEARKTISTWRFKPARNKGIPVNQRRKLIIDFTLE